MSILNEMLAYQEEDAKLLKIEQEISKSEERKKFVQAKKFIEAAREKLDAQEARAGELRQLVGKLTERYKEIQDSIAECATVDENVDDGGISYYKRSAQQLSDTLRGLKGELNKLIEEIEKACDEYKKIKKQTIEMQKQYKEYDEKYKELKASREAEVNEMKKSLVALAKNIPADKLEKYKTKRKEKIFPILVPLTGGRCGSCRYDLSVVQQSKLDGGNVIECEHCGCFIYKQ